MSFFQSFDMDNAICGYGELRREQTRLEESSGNTNWRILQTWIDRTSRNCARVYCTDTGYNDQWLFRISWCKINLQWKINSRFQSISNLSQTLGGMLSGGQSLRSNLYETYLWHRENVFDSLRAVIDLSSTLYQGHISLSKSKMKIQYEKYRKTCCQT